MEKKVKINDKEYTVKEMSYVDALDLDPNDKKGSAIKMFKACVDITDEEINNLTAKEGIQLQKAIDEVNALKDFQ